MKLETKVVSLGEQNKCQSREVMAPKQEPPEWMRARVFGAPSSDR